MTDIDWSRAQESDTHYDPVNRVFVNFDAMHYWDRKLIPRPVLPCPGDGLPPIGTECECRVTAWADWVPCVIVAHHKKYAIAFVDDDTVMLSCGIRFRPIKIPDHPPRSERDAAIDDMAGWAGVTGLPIDRERKILGRLYDGGYRKQEKQE